MGYLAERGEADSRRALFAADGALRQVGSSRANGLAGLMMLRDPLHGLLVYLGLTGDVHDDAGEFVNDDVRGRHGRVGMDELVTTDVGDVALRVGGGVDLDIGVVGIRHAVEEDAVCVLPGAMEEVVPGSFRANDVEGPLMDGGVLGGDMQEGFSFLHADGGRFGSGCELVVGENDAVLREGRGDAGD